jgi:hypothetical protein
MCNQALFSVESKLLYKPTRKWFDKLVIPLYKLTQKYKDSIEYSHIGFPEDWIDMLNW